MTLKADANTLTIAFAEHLSIFSSKIVYLSNLLPCVDDFFGDSYLLWQVWASIASFRRQPSYVYLKNYLLSGLITLHNHCSWCFDRETNCPLPIDCSYHLIQCVIWCALDLRPSITTTAFAATFAKSKDTNYSCCHDCCLEESLLPHSKCYLW